MIVDLVRASNDVGDHEFIAFARRLNVLLSRQQETLAVTGDHKIFPWLDIYRSPSTQDQGINKTEKEKEQEKISSSNKSKYLIRMF